MVLTPLPFLVVFELPLVAQLPVELFLQIVIPTFAGSLALMTSAILLAERRAGDPMTLGEAWHVLRGHGRAATASALVAAGLAILITALPFLGLLLTLVFLPLYLGPPLLGHSVALERLGLREGFDRVRSLTARNGGRVFLYLIATALAIGAIAILLIGGVGAFLLVDAPYALRVVGYSLLQGVALGALVGYLATFELVVYQDLKAAAALRNP